MTHQLYPFSKKSSEMIACPDTDNRSWKQTQRINPSWWPDKNIYISKRFRVHTNSVHGVPVILQSNAIMKQMTISPQWPNITNSMHIFHIHLKMSKIILIETRFHEQKKFSIWRMLSNPHTSTLLKWNPGVSIIHASYNQSPRECESKFENHTCFSTFQQRNY